ncbi:MAG TPA: addiction module protein [Bryobacteraceae bacterium]|nr:addiction module protein [Bryobacteraceae bacterium]
MARDVADILVDALALPSEARAALITSLLDSLEPEIDEGAEELWQQEILERIKQLDRGSVRPIPWLEARSRLTAKDRRGG